MPIESAPSAIRGLTPFSVDFDPLERAFAARASRYIIDIVLPAMCRKISWKTSAMIAIKRAYDHPSRADGTRILVDRLWPRGINKQQLQADKWIRELGPSNELRKFFGHDPARWQEFRRRYLAELKRAVAAALLMELVEIARAGPLTLIYSAKDKEHNQAIVLKELLDRRLANSD